MAKYYVSDESWQGFKIIKEENGKKFYLSKLAKNIKDSTWTSDSTCAKYFKNESKAEDIVDKLYTLIESKFVESSKLMNEKNVLKFVEELNHICHEEFDDDLFTSKYGNLYDFQVGYYGDVPNNWLIYDNNGTFDWFEDTFCRKLIDELLKKNGWYGEPCHSYGDFCVDTL